MKRKLFAGTLFVGGSNEPLAVMFLQAYLKALMGPRCSQGLAVDGEYGPVTADVVNCLRRRLGLELNGRFGPRLKTALARGSSKWKIAKLNFDAIEVEVPFVEMRASENGAVAAESDHSASNGSDTMSDAVSDGAASSVVRAAAGIAPDDGEFGPGTKAALSNFPPNADSSESGNGPFDDTLAGSDDTPDEMSGALAGAGSA